MSLQKTSPDIYALWDLLPKPDGIVRWFARNRDSSEIAGDFATSPKSLAVAARSYKHLNFYVQPNPTAQRTKMRSSAEDVSHWSYLFIDIDPVKQPGVVAEPFLALGWVLSVLGFWKGIDVKPLIIDSGRGAQAWVRLGDTPMLTKHDRHVARVAANHILHRLDASVVYEGSMRGQKIPGLHGCRVDVSCSDLPRLMRCPGTTNVYTGNTTHLVAPGVAHVGLAELLAADVPPSEFVERVVPIRPGRKWQHVVNRLTFTAAMFLKWGTEEPGRHKTMSATLKSLKDNGVAAEQAFEALCHGNEKTTPALNHKELQRMVDAEYKA